MRLHRIHHGVVDSTSERAFADIVAGAAHHGDVHLATGQTSGRGRLGRSWSSPRDEGLYLSLVLLPPPPPWNPGALTMAAGLAALDAAVALGLPGARLKWPNDLVVGNAKLAGVLVETRGFDPGRPHYVVGLGFNVCQEEFPAELCAERPVASLATLGLDVSIDTAREAVLEALAQRIEQAGCDHVRLASDFLGSTGLTSRLVRLQVGSEEHVGTLAGLSVAEGLLVRGSDGDERTFPLEIVRRLGPCL